MHLHQQRDIIFRNFWRISFPPPPPQKFFKHNCARRFLKKPGEAAKSPDFVCRKIFFKKNSYLSRPRRLRHPKRTS
ncbi:hypothetical protein ALC62_09296 [Cyphomyrmex costatus]|uniref:Uncharacterized protein n=1 Tax=Cyphomyrmex costatus TaxID=456900 RepID=A0A151IFK7_9HYME|nr:hypothetical protein ALC62_09296 [Cyphomyrmex costatus]